MRSFGYLAVLWMAALAPSAVLADPSTVDKPGKKVRFISLAEARAIALEQGSIGQPSLLISPRPGVTVLEGGKYSPLGPNHVLASAKPGSKSILLTGTQGDAETQRNLHQILLNIECAYWNLYGSYWQLYSCEEGLRLAYDTWKLVQKQYKAGRLDQASVAKAEDQYNFFRSQRSDALNTVLDNEWQLRAMLGMKMKDGTRLVPSDAPTLVEKKPDWNKGLRSAMKKRPELQMARQDVQLATGEVLIIEQGCAPLSDPVRQARSQWERSCKVLEDQELKAERYLGLWYRRISSAYSQIKAARAECEAFTTQLQVRYELLRAGTNEPSKDSSIALNLLLEAQRFWADALATECQAIATYNNALAGWEFAKGDIMKHAHVRLLADAPDDSNVVRAVDREHKRTRQHVRREPGALPTQPDDRGVPAKSPLWVLGACDSDKAAPSLPTLWKSYPPLKQVGDLKTGLVEGRIFH